MAPAVDMYSTWRMSILLHGRDDQDHPPLGPPQGGRKDRSDAAHRRFATSNGAYGSATTIRSHSRDDGVRAPVQVTAIAIEACLPTASSLFAVFRIFLAKARIGA